MPTLRPRGCWVFSAYTTCRPGIPLHWQMSSHFALMDRTMENEEKLVNICTATPLFLCLDIPAYANSAEVKGDARKKHISNLLRVIRHPAIDCKFKNWEYLLMSSLNSICQRLDCSLNRSKYTTTPGNLSRFRFVVAEKKNNKSSVKKTKKKNEIRKLTNYPVSQVCRFQHN